MATFRRTGSFVAYRFDGQLHDPADQAFAAALATRRFRTIENAASEEVSVGWCTPVDPTGDSFLLEDLDGGAGTWMRMRTDVKKMPAAWLQMHRAAAEKAKGKKLSARERRELKDDVLEKLLPRVLPRTGFVDALLFHDRKTLLLFSTSKGARESFGKLFFESFQALLVELGPFSLTLASSSATAAEKLEPHRWPGGSSSAAGDDPLSFLGEEFLLWLWWAWESDGGEFALPGGRIVGLALDDLVVFAPSNKDETTKTLRHGLPTRTREARIALSQGCRPSRARLLLAEGSRQWSFVLDASTLRCVSVKLPEDAEECESDVDRTADRSANWLALHQIVVGLFTRFVEQRLDESPSDGWSSIAVDLAAWMRGGAA